MADFLDMLFLERFSMIFAFLLIFVIVYAILNTIGFFKDNKSLNAFIAFLIAFFTMLSPKLLAIVKIITPWLFFMLFIAFFIIVSFKFLGTPEESFTKLLSKWSAVHSTLLGFLAFIVLIAFSQVYGDYFLQQSSATNLENASVTQTAISVVFQPKMLGLGVIFLIAAFAMMWLTITPKSK